MKKKIVLNFFNLIKSSVTGTKRKHCKKAIEVLKRPIDLTGTKKEQTVGKYPVGKRPPTDLGLHVVPPMVFKWFRIGLGSAGEDEFISNRDSDVGSLADRVFWFGVRVILQNCFS